MESWVGPLVDEAKFLLDRRATNSRMNGGIAMVVGSLEAGEDEELAGCCCCGCCGGGGLDGKMGGFEAAPIEDDDGVVGVSGAAGHSK